MQRATQFVEKLSRHTLLHDTEKAALLRVQGIVSVMQSGGNITRPEEDVMSCCIVLEGLLARSVHTADGNEQLTAFYVPGDMPDVHALLSRKQANLTAVCESKILRLARNAIRELVFEYPAIGEALWRESTSDFAIGTEWIVNIGQREAKARIAHLLCEVAYRTTDAQPQDFGFSFPVTQTQLAHATGMSTVHVNRVMQALRRDRVVEVSHHRVEIWKWDELRLIAGFDDGYLTHTSPQRLVPN
jgi:CRP-like cAMP-binding protein